jgi:hypothetical protein
MDELLCLFRHQCTHLRAARLLAASLHPFGVPLSCQKTMARCGRQPIMQASIAVMLGVLTLPTALSRPSPLIAAHQHDSLAKDERIEPTPTSTHPVSECTCMRTRMPSGRVHGAMLRLLQDSAVARVAALACMSHAAQLSLSQLTA